MKTLISENANINYLAQVVKIKEIEKHPNADSLQVAKVNFNNVITGMDTKVGDVMVYFPVECVINADFLSKTNSYRHNSLNADSKKTGFFDDNGRVKAVRLRGIASIGYLVPVSELDSFMGSVIELKVGDKFDTIGDVKILEKYVIPSKTPQCVKLGKKPRISRIVSGQVHLHVDTDKLESNIYNIQPEDTISITYKYHGTSWWVGNLMVNSKEGLIKRFIRKLFKIEDKTEYDIIFGSRKVVKNEYETQNTNDFYDGDLWSTIKEEVKNKIPKGFTIYGECVGFTSGGKNIQGKYDYGCNNGEHKIYVYRVTFTNIDGEITDLSSLQVKRFCKINGLEYVHLFYNGKAVDLYPDIKDDWHRGFFMNLKRDYTDKDCFLCSNKVPEEGIVVRKENVINFEAYKLKGETFLLQETKALDSGEENIEG